MTVPAFVLTLNLYVIMLEDKEEERFFKNGKKSAGKGVYIVNFALLGSILALSIAVYFKFVLGHVRSHVSAGVAYDDSSEYDDNGTYLGSGNTQETVLFIEECLMHALAVVECVTLREYAKAKLKDMSAFRKRK